MASRNEQLVESQQVFRSANERMQALAVAIVPAEQVIPFLCECADDGCLGRVDMSLGDFDDIHRDRDRYAILRDHQLANGEQVVEQRPLFDIVSKDGLVAR
jgi:hypothetical protein